jgi:hypothetical protein
MVQYYRQSVMPCEWISKLPCCYTDGLSSLTTNSRLLHDLAANHGGSLSPYQGEALSKAVNAAWTLLQMVTSEQGVSPL